MKLILYHGGTLFGKSVDDPKSCERAVLGTIFLLFLWWKRIPLEILNHNLFLIKFLIS